MGMYVEKILCEDFGGGSVLDIIVLKDGRCLGISDESVVLYPNHESMYEGFDGEVKMIDLTPKSNDVAVKKMKKLLSEHGVQKVKQMLEDALKDDQ